MGDLGARVGSREQLLRPLHGGEHHIDGDIAIGVAVHLNAGAMHPFDPGVQLVLRLGDVAFVGRRNAGVGRADRHGALGERSVDGMFGSGSQPDPLVAEAGHHAARDHGVQHLARGLVTDAMKQLPTRAHFLQRREVAAFVMHAGDTVTHELLRNVSQGRRGRAACSALR